LWRHTFPSDADTADHQLFIYWNYLCVLYSKGYYKDATLPLADSVSQADWVEFTRRLERKKQRLLANLPDHYELVTAIRAAAEQDAKFQAPPGAAAGAGAFRATVPVPDWGQELERA
jgi:hypothetical protein